MHQPMRGDMAQVQKDQFRYYDHGWNAYAAGEPYPGRASGAHRDFEEGWNDCREATKKYGAQEPI